MTFPTIVYTLMQVDAEGKPRGFHKALPLFYYEEERAIAERKCRDMEHNTIKYSVQECIIMGRAEYQRMVVATGWASL